MLAEVQQSSGITYRVWDWNRVDSKGAPRELHINKSLDVINFDPAAPSLKESMGPLWDEWAQFQMGNLRLVRRHVWEMLAGVPVCRCRASQASGTAVLARTALAMRTFRGSPLRSSCNWSAVSPSATRPAARSRRASRSPSSL